MKNLPAMQETRQELWLGSLGQEDPLEEGMATHSSILAWRIPWAEKPGGLQSLESQRVRVTKWLTISLFFFWQKYFLMPPGHFLGCLLDQAASYVHWSLGCRLELNCAHRVPNVYILWYCKANCNRQLKWKKHHREKDFLKEINQNETLCFALY